MCLPQYRYPVAVLYPSRRHWVQPSTRPKLRLFRTATNPNKDMPHIHSWDLVRSSDALILDYLDCHERRTLEHNYDGRFIYTRTTISRIRGPFSVLLQIDFPGKRITRLPLCPRARCRITSTDTVHRRGYATSPARLMQSTARCMLATPTSRISDVGASPGVLFFFTPEHCPVACGHRRCARPRAKIDVGKLRWPAVANSCTS